MKPPSIASEDLYAAPELIVSFITNPAFEQKRGLVFTFNGFANLEGEAAHKYGFGGDHLLKSGFDVVAFKLIRNNWYQTVPREVFDTIRSFFAAKPAYPSRATYGGSMGGFAAMVFAGLLDCDRAFAACPQYRLDFEQDSRWAAEAQEIQFQYLPCPELVAPGCTYVVLLDPWCIDVLHVARYRELLGPQLLEYHLPLAGHNPLGFLNESGFLKPLVVDVLSAPQLPVLDVKAVQRGAKSYVAQLARQLATTGKPKWAVGLLESSIAASPVPRPELHALCSDFYLRVNDQAGALRAVEQAAAAAGNRPMLLFNLSRYLGKMPSNAQAQSKAREFAALATEGNPEIEKFWVQRIELLIQGQLWSEARAVLNRALPLRPLSSPLLALNAQVLAQEGSLEPALQAAEQALERARHHALPERDLHLLRAEILEALGQTEAACELRSWTEQQFPAQEPPNPDQTMMAERQRAIAQLRRAAYHRADGALLPSP